MTWNVLHWTNFSNLGIVNRNYSQGIDSFQFREIPNSFRIWDKLDTNLEGALPYVDGLVEGALAQKIEESV